MKTFAIDYVCRFEYNKDYYTEHIQARTKESALKKFAKMNDINDHTKLLDENFDWWDENNCLNKFMSIYEVEEIICPHCNGLGKIKVDKLWH